MEGLQDGSTQGPSDFLLYPQGCASERYWDLELLVMSVSLSHLFSLTMPTIPHTLPQAELCPWGSVVLVKGCFLNCKMSHEH